MVGNIFEWSVRQEIFVYSQAICMGDVCIMEDNIYSIGWKLFWEFLVAEEETV